jgi:hypothetical protein
VRRKLHNESLNFIGTKCSLGENELKGSSRHPDIMDFDLSSIVAATDNFSPTNKIGQGGFGSVFKVHLQFIMSLVFFFFFFFWVNHNVIVDMTISLFCFVFN